MAHVNARRVAGHCVITGLSTRHCLSTKWIYKHCCTYSSDRETRTLLPEQFTCPRVLHRNTCIARKRISSQTRLTAWLTPERWLRGRQMTIDQLPPNALIISFHFLLLFGCLCVSGIISAKRFTVFKRECWPRALTSNWLGNCRSPCLTLHRSVGCLTSVSDTVSLLKGHLFLSSLVLTLKMQFEDQFEWQCWNVEQAMADIAPALACTEPCTCWLSLLMTITRVRTGGLLGE